MARLSMRKNHYLRFSEGGGDFKAIVITPKAVSNTKIKHY